MPLFYRYLFLFSCILGLSVAVCAQATEIKLRSKIDRIVSKLRLENEVHFGYAVGIAGIPETNNKYYKLYLKLKRNATNEELFLLTDDTAKCIVVYSFEILWQRQFPELRHIFLYHQNDTAKFWTAGGCTGIIDQVNFFMLRKMKPMQKDGVRDYLTKEEYDFYCKQFKKESEWFSCE